MSPDCLKLKIWSLQCKFSELAEKYMNNMLLGISCPEQLDYLKTFRRTLLLLNRNNQVPLPTVSYTATVYGTYTGIIFYTDEYNDSTKKVAIDASKPATICAVEDSLVLSPEGSGDEGVNIVKGAACDGCAKNIDIDTINKIIETLEKKY